MLHRCKTELFKQNLRYCLIWRTLFQHRSDEQTLPRLRRGGVSLQRTKAWKESVDPSLKVHGVVRRNSIPAFRFAYRLL